ncbi:MAG: PKD domain-containing protein [Chthonomonadales bacterium]
MVKFARSGFLAVSALVLALPALCQSTDVTLYGGDKPSDTGMSVSSWGSGGAELSTEYVFSGIGSLKVTTHGRYQGVRLSFAKPIDMKAASASPGSYLQFVYMISEKAGAGSINEGGFSGKGGVSGLSPGGGSSGGRTQGGGSGRPGGNNGLSGNGSGESLRTFKVRPPTYFRVVLGTDDGHKTEINLDLSTSKTEMMGWKQIAVPVSSIKGLKGTSGKVMELQFFADQSCIVYLGEIRLLTDATPISVSDLNDVTIASNDILTLSGSAEAGATPLRYVWTIQGIPSTDAMEGSTVTRAYLVTGEGKNFKHQFRKKGDYQVTLTVEDEYGVKKSGTAAMKVHVTL